MRSPRTRNHRNPALPIRTANAGSIAQRRSACPRSIQPGPAFVASLQTGQGEVKDILHTSGVQASARLQRRSGLRGEPPLVSNWRADGWQDRPKDIADIELVGGHAMNADTDDRSGRRVA